MDTAKNTAQRTQNKLPADRPHFGWVLLGLLLPMAGLMLFLFLRETRPKTARAAGIGGAVGTVFWAGFFILSLVGSYLIGG